MKDCQPASPIERPAGSAYRAAYGLRYVADCVCFGGHTTAPHHLSGPPPPAKAMLEIGATLAVQANPAVAATAGGLALKNR